MTYFADRVWTEADEWEYQGWSETVNRENGIEEPWNVLQCPMCGSWDTVRLIVSPPSACDERYCAGCESDYVAE